MKTISKGREPASLTEHRAGEYCGYDNYAAKDELRAALVKEQRGLCCYCMGRISASSTRMKIEHWRCQSLHPELELSYENILGACLGGDGQPPDERHCDTRKGDQTLKWNPAMTAARVGQRIRYEPDGTIAADDAEFHRQLDVVLGLNIPGIKKRRWAVLEGILEWWHAYHAAHHRRPPRDVIARQRARWEALAGDLPAYSGVAVWWLDQRLASTAA